MVGGLLKNVLGGSPSTTQGDHVELEQCNNLMMSIFYYDNTLALSLTHILLPYFDNLSVLR